MLASQHLPCRRMTALNLLRSFENVNTIHHLFMQMHALHRWMLLSSQRREVCPARWAVGNPSPATVFMHTEHRTLAVHMTIICLYVFKGGCRNCRSVSCGRACVGCRGRRRAEAKLTRG